ncbi:unnamed protein product [Adineta steineri]|uniref:MAM domain-containing protein n=1 Tax=Adineta steineri TaxID=433720 RepID=A0A819PM89_9BILA|nr:unnamed protein product [Adineta steineri]CAF4017535.1 unnamed protein product [Adineta steineri]
MLRLISPTASMQTNTQTSSSKPTIEITTISDETSTTTSTTTTITTTEPPILIFTCDFSDNLCFQDNQLTITNGAQFNSSDLSQPPRAPLSDATSISKPTADSYKCNLPYQLSIDNSANTSNWDMWFCYNNECPTNNGNFSTCTSGNYGLISIEPWETNKTISSVINENMITRGFVEGEQCLSYYYYITLDDGIDYGQQISVSIRSDNISNSEIEIDRLSIADMRENRWHQRNVTFNSTSTSYTLIFSFEVRDGNRTENEANNKTIYFALDDIDIYNRNCDDLIELSITSTTITTTEISTITSILTTIGATNPPTTPSNLGLVLGLSLGIGSIVLLGIIGSIVYYFKIIKPKHKINVNTTTTDDIPMVSPNNTTDNNTTVDALVV